jgi:CBS domain-containing protein
MVSKRGGIMNATGIKLAELEDRLKSVKAGEIMTKEVVTTTPDTTLAELSKIMIEKRINGVPVIEKGSNKIVGVITRTDLFAIMGMIKSGGVIDGGQKGCCNPTVKFGMAHQVVTITTEATLGDIIEMMSTRGIHTFPVVEKDAIIGVIGIHDVFEKFYSILSELAESKKRAP